MKFLYDMFCDVEKFHEISLRYVFTNNYITTDTVVPFCVTIYSSSHSPSPKSTNTTSPVSVFVIVILPDVDCFCSQEKSVMMSSPSVVYFEPFLAVPEYSELILILLLSIMCLSIFPLHVIFVSSGRVIFKLLAVILCFCVRDSNLINSIFISPVIVASSIEKLLNVVVIVLFLSSNQFSSKVVIICPFLSYPSSNSQSSLSKVIVRRNVPSSRVSIVLL